MKTLRSCLHTVTLVAALGLLHQGSLTLAQAGDTKPFKETNVMIFRQDVAPGSFTHPEFEAIRAVRGLEDAASVNVMTSHSNVAGKGTRFPLNIVYITTDAEGNVVLEIYSVNNLLTPEGSWINAWGELKSYYSGPKVGTFEGTWFFTGGTGRFEGVTGEGTLTGTQATEDQPTQYTAVGVISTMGSLNRDK